MKNSINILLITCLFYSCNNKDRPLQILPMTADIPYDSELKQVPILGDYYTLGFYDDKQHLKDLLRFIKDSIRTQLPFDPDPYKGYDTKDSIYSAGIYIKNSGIYFDDRRAYINQKHYFSCSFYKKDTRYFTGFGTWSKFQISEVSFKEECNYKYEMQKDSNNVTNVIIEYEKFNTDAWQQFLNIVYYDRLEQRYNDYKKYNLWTIEKIKKWDNWSSSIKYILKNPCTNEIDCIVEYPFNDENCYIFTIEIP